MSCRKRVNLAPYGTDLIKLAAIKTPVLIKNKTAGCFLLNIMKVPVYKHCISRCILRELCNELSLNGIKTVSPGLFVRSAGGKRITLVIGFIPYLFAEILIIPLMTIYPFYSLANHFGKFFLRNALWFDGIMGYAKGLEHYIFRNLLHLSFHHHDVFICCPDDYVKISRLNLLKCWVDDELSVDPRHPYFGYRSVERYVRHCQCS